MLIGKEKSREKCRKVKQKTLDTPPTSFMALKFIQIHNFT